MVLQIIVYTFMGHEGLSKTGFSAVCPAWHIRLFRSGRQGLPIVYSWEMITWTNKLKIVIQMLIKFWEFFISFINTEYVNFLALILFFHFRFHPKSFFFFSSLFLLKCRFASSCHKIVMSSISTLADCHHYDLLSLCQ